VSARQPPHDLDAEAAVLSACMLDAGVLPEIRAVLAKPEAFYSESNRKVYETILALDDAGIPVDVALVAARLREREQLGAVGGVAYLARLTDATPAFAHMADHARVVGERYRKRRLIAACESVAAEGYCDTGTEDWFANSLARISDAADAADQRETLTVARDAAARVVDLLGARSRKEIDGAGIPTGFPYLDQLLNGGLRRGCQYCVAGLTGHGKSALALGIATHVAAKGHGVFIQSCEMPTEQLVIRAMAQMGGLDAGAVEQCSFDDADEGWRATVAAANDFGNLPIAIDERPAQTVAGVRTAARRALARLRKEHGPHIELGLVVCDYIQIMKGERHKGDSREQEVASISKGLMWLAKELNCAVLTLSQFNREGAKVVRPRLSDLRDSGSIEQDNFGILIVYREDAANPKSTPNGEAEVIVAKQRQGPTGVVHMRFRGPSMSFFEEAGAQYESDQQRAVARETDDLGNFADNGGQYR
jgi:replicative DNA helicase